VSEHAKTGVGRDSPDPGTTGLRFGQLLRLFVLLLMLFALLFRLFALRLLFIAATTSCSKGNQQADDRPAPRASGLVKDEHIPRVGTVNGAKAHRISRDGLAGWAM
jgi:hypothetical protein